MGRIILIGLAILVAAGAFVAANSVFIVDERQQALVLRFGSVQRVENAWADGSNQPGAETGAGLKFKLPWENVIYFDRRNLEFDSQPREIFASDQERLIVDAFVRYRINDPLRFYQAVNNERIAETRLQAFLEGNLRRVLGAVQSSDIISGQRAELMRSIQDGVNAQVSDSAEGLGIEVIDVKIKRADLPQENAERVFARMETQRRQEAERIRAEGDEEALRIRAEAEREVRVIVAQANEQGERIRGEGDAERNEIYAAAYTKDEEFFAFYRSMLAYETAIDAGTTMVLSPDSEFFEYFGSDRPGGR